MSSWRRRRDPALPKLLGFSAYAPNALSLVLFRRYRFERERAPLPVDGGVTSPSRFGPQHRRRSIVMGRV